MFRVLFVLVALVIIVVFIVVIVALVRSGTQSHRQNKANAASPLLTCSARVIDKRTAVSGGSDMAVTTMYFATFELPDGGRMEFKIADTDYGLLAVGDPGTLMWQGTWYKGFQRELLR